MYIYRSDKSNGWKLSNMSRELSERVDAVNVFGLVLHDENVLNDEFVFYSEFIQSYTWLWDKMFAGVDLTHGFYIYWDDKTKRIRIDKDIPINLLARIYKNIMGEPMPLCPDSEKPRVIDDLINDVFKSVVDGSAKYPFKMAFADEHEMRYVIGNSTRDLLYIDTKIANTARIMNSLTQVMNSLNLSTDTPTEEVSTSEEKFVSTVEKYNDVYVNSSKFDKAFVSVLILMAMFGWIATISFIVSIVMSFIFE